MKKSIIAVLAVSAISTLGSSAAFAHEDYSEGGALHWLEHVQARASSPTERGDWPRMATRATPHPPAP